MSKSKIPQYHPSYTEEENQQMYDVDAPLK